MLEIEEVWVCSFFWNFVRTMYVQFFDLGSVSPPEAGRPVEFYR